jgi:hypothetical protein
MIVARHNVRRYTLRPFEFSLHPSAQLRLATVHACCGIGVIERFFAAGALFGNAAWCPVSRRSIWMTLFFIVPPLVRASNRKDYASSVL